MRGYSISQQLNQGNLVAPAEIDLFNSMVTKGIDPGTVANNITREDKLVLNSPDYYKQQTFGERVPDKEELKQFTDAYQKVSDYYTKWNSAKEVFPDITQLNNQLSHVTDPSLTMSINLPNSKLIANQSFMTAGPYAQTPEYLLSDQERATANNFYLEKKGDEDIRIDGTVTKNMARGGEFNLDYTENGPVWRKGDPGDELYGKIRKSIWGDQRRFGTSLMDGVYGFLSGATVETAQSFATAGKVIDNFIAQSASKDKLDEGLSDNYWNRIINELEAMKFKPSEETQQYGFLSGPDGFSLRGFAYNFGQGLGMLAPQFATAGLGSAVGLGAKALSVLAGVGTVQAVGGFYEGAREAGLDQTSAANLSLLASPAVYLTEKALSAPWIMKKFGVDAKNQFKTFTKDVVEKNLGKGVDMTQEVNQAKAVKTAYAKFLESNKDLFKKIKNGEVGFDKIRGISGAVREGSQEGLEESYYMALEGLYDKIWADKDAKVGEGKFGTRFDQEGLKRLKENFIGGAILGGVVDAVVRNPRKKVQEEFIRQRMIEKGPDLAEKELFDLGQEMYREGIFGSQDITNGDQPIYSDTKDNPDVEGIEVKEDLPIIGGKTIKSQADTNLYSFLKQVQMEAQLVRESGLSDMGMLKLLEGDRKEYGQNAFFNGIGVAGTMRGIRSEIDNLNNQLTGTLDKPVTPEQTESINKQIKDKEDEYIRNKNVYDFLVKPEEGSVFSPAINRYAKETLAEGSYAKKKIDEWSHVNPRENEKTRNKKYAEYINEYRQKNYDIGSTTKAVKSIADYVRKVQDNIKTIEETRQANVPLVNEKIAAVKGKKDLSSLLNSINELVTTASQTEIPIGEQNTVIDQVRQTSESITGTLNEQLNKINPEAAGLYSAIQTGNTSELTRMDEQQKSQEMERARDEAFKLSEDISRLEEEKKTRTTEEGTVDLDEKIADLRQEMDMKIPAIEEEYSMPLENRMKSRMSNLLSKEPEFKQVATALEELKNLPEKMLKLFEQSNASLTELKNQYGDLVLPATGLTRDQLLKMDNDGILGKVMTAFAESKIKEYDEVMASGNEERKKSYFERMSSTDLDKDIEMAERMNEAGRVGNEIIENYLNNHPDKNMRAHVSNNDIPISNELYTGKGQLKAKLAANIEKLTQIRLDYEKYAGSAKIESKRVYLRHVELTRRTIKLIVDTLAIREIGVLNELEKITPLTTDDIARDKDGKLLEKEINERIIAAEKAILSIKKWMYANKTLFTADQIMKILAPFHANNLTYIAENDFERLDFFDIVDGGLKQDDSKNKFLFVSTENFLETTLSADPIAVERAIKTVVENEQKRTSPPSHAPTFEQLTAIRQLTSFLSNGKISVLDQIFQQEKAANDQRNIANTGNAGYNLLTKYKPNFFVLRGDYDAGKTTVVFRTALAAYQQMTGKKPVVGIVSLSNELQKTWSDSLGDTVKATSKYFLNTSALEESWDGVDILVWDEASGLTKDDILRIKEKSGDTPVVFIGDYSQMVSLSEPRPDKVVAFEHVGFKSTPVTTNFSSGLPFLKHLANAYRKLFYGNVNLELPLCYAKEIDGEKYGSTYYLNTDQVMAAFLADTNDDKALVFTTAEAAQESINANIVKYPELINHLDKIYISNIGIKQDLRSFPVLTGGSEYTYHVKVISGLRKDNVYMGNDFMSIKDIPSQGIDTAGKAIYTLIGRSRNFIGLIADPTKRANSEKEVVFGNPKAVDGASSSVGETKAYKDLMVVWKDVESEPSEQPIKKEEVEKDDSPIGKTVSIINKGSDSFGCTIKVKKITRKTRKTNDGPVDYREFSGTVVVGNDKKKVGDTVTVWESSTDFVKTDQPEPELTVKPITDNFLSLSNGRVVVGGLVMIDGVSHEVTGLGTLDGRFVVLTDNGVYPVEKVVPSDRIVTEPIDDLNAIVETNKITSNLRKPGSHVAWGTSHTFLSDRVISEYQRDQIRKLKRVLIAFSPLTDLSVEVWLNHSYINDKTNTEITGADSVVVKLNYTDEEIDSILQDINEDTESWIIKDAIRLIKQEGFYDELRVLSALDRNDSNPEVRKDLNDLIERARTEGKKTGKNRINLGKTSVINDGVFPGIWQTSTEPANSRELIDELKEMGYTVSSQWVQENVSFRGNDEAVAMVRKVSMNGKFHTFLIGRMPKFMKMSKEVVKEKLLHDLQAIKNTKTLAEFNNLINSSYLMQVLLYNRSSLSGKRGISRLTKMFADHGINWDSKGVNFGERGSRLSSQKDVYADTINWMLAEWDGADGNIFREDLYIPSQMRDRSTKEIIDTDDIEVKYNIKDPIHAPNMFFNLDPLFVDQQGKVNKDEKITEDEFDGPDLLMEEEFAHVSQLTDSASIKELIDEILGVNKKEVLINSVKTFKNKAGRNLYGSWSSKRISINEVNGRVEVRVGRHEVAHDIFNLGLTSKMKNAIRREFEQRDGTNYSLTEISEKLAQEYERFGDQPIKGRDPWYTPSGLLQRVREFLNKILYRLNLYRPTIESLFRDMEEGFYARTKYNKGIRWTQSESMNMEESETDEESVEQEPEALRVDYKANYILLKDTFSNRRGQIARFVSAMLNSNSVFDNNTFTLTKAIGQLSIGEIVSKARETINKRTNTYKVLVSSRGMVSQLSREQMLAIRNEEIVFIANNKERKVTVQSAWEQIQLSRADVFAATLQTIFPNIKIDQNSFKKYSAIDIFDDWAKTDPTKYIDDVVRWQLNSTPLLSNDGTWDGKSYIKGEVMMNYLYKASLRARQFIEKGNVKNPVSALRQSLLTEAKSIKGSTDKGNTINSFVQRWLGTEEGFRNPANNRSFYGFGHVFGQEVNVNENPEQRIKRDTQSIQVYDLLNSILSLTMNTGNRHQTDVIVKRTRKGKDRYIIRQASLENEDAVKDLIKDSVINRNYSWGSEEIRKEQKDMVLGERKMYDIQSDGILYTKHDQSIRIIDFKDGQYTFTRNKAGKINLTNDILTELVSNLGLGNVNHEVFRDIVKGNVSKDFLTFFSTRIPHIANLGSADQILAAGLYNMLQSLRVNALVDVTIKNKLEALGESYKELTDEGKDEKLIEVEKKVVNEIKSGEPYRAMLKYMKDMSQLAGEESIGSHLNNDNRSVLETEAIITPDSFFNFFKALGAINMFYDNEERNKFITDLNGKHRFAFTVESHLTRLFSEGSDGIARKVNNLIHSGKELLVDKINKSPYMEVKDGELVIYNPFADLNNPTTIRFISELTSMRKFKATNNPTTEDWTRSIWEIFMEGIGKTNPEVIVPSAMIPGKEQAYLIHMLPDGTFKTLLFDQQLQYNYKTNRYQKVKLSKWVNKEVDNLMQKHKQLSKVRKQNLAEFLSSSPLSDYFSEFITEKNPYNFNAKFNRGVLAAMSAGQTTSSMVKLLRKSSLMKNAYWKTATIDGKEMLQLGNSILLNGPVFNFNNIKKWDAAVKEGTQDAARVEIFNDELMGAYLMMKRNGWVVPSIIKGQITDTDNTEIYRRGEPDERRKKKGLKGKVVEWNPFFEGFVMAQLITAHGIGDFINGHYTQMTDQLEFSKRNQPNATPTQSAPNDQYGINERLHFIPMETKFLQSTVPGAKPVELRNGEIISNLLAHKFLYHQIGGEFSFIDAFNQKPLIDSVDPVTLEKRQIKCASMMITGDIFENSLTMQDAHYAALRYTDKLTGTGTDYKLESRFKELYEENKRLNKEDPFEKAIDQMYLEIVRHKDSELIRKNLMYAFVDESSFKMGATNLNNYSGLNGELSGIQIPVEDFGFILNPYQDPEQFARQVVKMNQILAYKFATDKAKDIAWEINSILGTIIDDSFKSFEKAIRNERGYGDTKRQREIVQFERYLRKRGINLLEKQSFAGTFAEIVTNKSIALDFPGIRELLLNSYRNHFNSEIVNQKMDGFRAIQFDGVDFPVLESDGIIYNLKDFTRRFGFDRSKLKKIATPENASGDWYTYEVDGKTFTMRPPKFNQSGQIGEVQMPFAHAQVFGLRKEEDIHDLFTIYDSDGTALDLRTSPEGKINRVYTKLAQKKGKDESIAELEWVDKSPALRLFASKDITYSQFKNGINNVLHSYQTRVPSGNLGCGDWNNLVGIIKTSGNIALLPSENVIFNDSDFDADMKSIFFKTLDSSLQPETKGIPGKFNRLLDLLDELYSMPEAAENIYVVSSLEDMKSLAKKYKSPYDYYGMAQRITDQDYVTTGDESISIYANSVGAVSYLMENRDKLETVAPGFSGLLSKIELKGKMSVLNKLSSLLQSALDDKKLRLLPSFGLSYEAAPLAVAHLIMFNDFKEMQRFFKHPIVEDFLATVNNGRSILSTDNEKRVPVILDKLISDNQTRIKRNTERMGKGLLPSLEIARNRYNELFEKKENKPLSPEEQTEYNNLQDYVETIDDTEIINTLYDLAILSNNIYSLSRVITLRNGVVVNDNDHELANRNLELFLGMSKKDFLIGSRPTVDQKMNYWRRNSQEYQYGDYPEVMEKFQRAVYTSMNLSHLVRRNPYLHQLTQKQFESDMLTEGVFGKKTEGYRTISDRIQRSLNMIGWNFPKQAIQFHKIKDELVLDHFFKHAGYTYKLPVFGSYTDAFGQIRYKPLYEKLNASMDLKTGFGRMIFRKLFPEYFSQLQRLASLDTETAIQQMPLVGSVKEMNELIDTVRHNEFFKKLKVVGESGAQFVQFGDRRNFKPEDVEFMKDEFERLPATLKRLFEINHLVNSKLVYSKGSMADIIGTELYPEISKSVHAVNSFLNGEKQTLDGKTFDDIADIMIDRAYTDISILPYMSQKDLGEMQKDTSGKSYPAAFVMNTRHGHANWKSTFKRNADNTVNEIFSPHPLDMNADNQVEYQPLNFMEPSQLENMMITIDSGISKPWKFNHTFHRGHGYNVGDLLITPSGHVMKVVSTTNTTVYFQFANGEELEVSREQQSQKRKDILEKWKTQQGTFPRQRRGFGWAIKSANGLSLTEGIAKRYNDYQAKLPKGTVITTSSGDQYNIDEEISIHDFYTTMVLDRIQAKTVGNLITTRKDKLTTDRDKWDAFFGAYREWARLNPQLMDELTNMSGGKVLTDKYAQDAINPAHALSILLGKDSAPEMNDILPREDKEVQKEVTEPGLFKMNTAEGHVKEQRLVPELMERATNQSHSIDILLDKLSKRYGIQFISEPDARTNPDGSVATAWVGKDGVHYSSRHLTMGTPIHELSHIWLDMIKISNPDLYRILRLKASGMEGTEFYDTIKKNYPHLSKEELEQEVISTIAGLVSEPAVEAWLKSHAINSTSLISRLWDSVKGIGKIIFDFIKDIFWGSSIGQKTVLSELDFSNATIQDIMLAFAEDVLVGNQLLGETDMNRVMVSVTGVNNREMRKSDLRIHVKSSPIRVLSDIKDYLSNGYSTDVSSDMTDDALVDNLYNKRTFATDRSGKESVIVVFGGRSYAFDRSLESDSARLKAEIRSKIVEPFKSEDKDLANKLVNLGKKSKTRIFGEDLLIEARKIFSVNNEQIYSDDVLNQLINILGLNADVYDVMRYSQLKESTNPKIKALYDDAMVGNDPLIVIHGIDDKVHLSVFDTTLYGIGAKGKQTIGNNLFSTFLTDSEFQANEGELNNTEGDIRQLLLGVQMMSMQNNMDITVRNIGVLSVHKSSITKKMMPDIRKVVKHVKMISDGRLEGSKSFLSRFENTRLRDVITNQELLDHDYSQSFIARLRNYYNLTNDAREYPVTLFEGSMTEHDLRKAITRRMKSLEGSLSSNYSSRQEYTFLSLALMQNETKERYWVNDITDMSSWAMRATPIHNVMHDVLQYVRDRAVAVKGKVVKRMMDAQNEVRKEVDAVVNIYLQNHGVGRLRERIGDIGSKYFERMFRTVMVDGKKVILPEIHWDVHDPETSRLLASGDLSMAEINLANKMLSQMEEQWKRLFYYNKTKYGEKIKREESDALFMETYKRGQVPTIGKSANELITTLNLKAGLTKFIDRFSNYEALMEDSPTNMDKHNELSSYLFSQKDEEMRLEMAGLQMKDGKIEVINSERNEQMSTNLQNLYNYFMLEGIRKETYERELIPDYNAALAIFNMLEESGESQKYNRQLLDEYMGRLVYQRNADDKSVAFKIGDQQFTASMLVRTMIHGLTFVKLGFNLNVGMKSFILNEIAGMVTSISNSLANLFSSVDNRDEWFGIKEYTQAHALLTGKGLKKAMAIASELQLVNRSERDMLEDPGRNRTDRNIFTEKIAHIANRGTDSYARMVAMVSQMLKEGSWEAYTYDPKEGTISYDVRKDNRFYENGLQRTKNHEDIILRDLRIRLIRQGVQKNEDEAMKLGHDFILADNFKWLSDKFIIGSMDNLAKSLMGNVMVGAMFSQFRLFSYDRLANAGMFNKTHKSRAGSRFVAVQDESGDWISKKELIEIEGAWQSWGRSVKELRDLMKMGDKDFMGWWQNLSPIRRMNLASTIVKTSLFALMFLLVKGFDDDDDEKRFNFLYSDLLAGMVASEYAKNPFPALRSASQMIDAAFGKGDFLKTSLGFIPGKSSVDLIDWAVKLGEEDGETKQ